MNSKIAITVIVLVAVVMGMSAIVPMIQYAEARHGERLTTIACNALDAIKNPSPGLLRLIEDHCPPFVPPPS